MRTLLLIVFAAFQTSTSYAQCTANPALAGEDFGFWPEVIPYVQACTGCGDATRVLDHVTLIDTVVTVQIFQTTVYFDKARLVEVIGVPPVLSYGTDVESGATGLSPFGEWNNTGTAPNAQSTQGCIYFTGSEADWITLVGGGPNNDGIYPLTLAVDVRISLTDPDATPGGVNNGDWLSEVPVNVGGGLMMITDYFLDVRSSIVGITPVESEKLMVLKSYPNPVDGITTITFNSPNADKNLNFRVYSILGNEVLNKQMNAQSGSNTFDFDASALNSGVYIFTLSNGRSTITSKMIVK